MISNTLNHRYMTVNRGTPGYRFYTIKSLHGLLIMRVEIAHIEKFETVYSSEIIGKGYTLYDALIGTAWEGKAATIPGTPEWEETRLNTELL